MNDWLKVLVPILLTAALVAQASLYDRLVKLEQSTMHSELIDHRLNKIEEHINKEIQWHYQSQ